MEYILKNRLIIPLLAIFGAAFGGFIIRVGNFVSSALVSCVFILLGLYLYPVIGLIAIAGTTHFIAYGEALPGTDIGSINIPDIVLFFLFSVIIFKIFMLREKSKTRA